MARTVFTSSAVRTMRRMARDGSGAKAIAAAINSTPGSVKVECSKRGIRLRRGGNSVRGVKVVALVRRSTVKAIRSEAQRMNVTEGALATMVWEAIVEGDLFRAVLDPDK
jgi:hypothetical protein